MKKNNILIAVQERTPLSYEVVNEVYKITNSYDAILRLDDMSSEFNIDIIDLAQFLYKNSF